MYNTIIRLCKEQNINIAELERRAELSNGTIKKWRESVPSVTRAFNVARALGVSVEYLFDSHHPLQYFKR